VFITGGGARPAISCFYPSIRLWLRNVSIVSSRLALRVVGQLCWDCGPHVLCTLSHLGVFVKSITLPTMLLVTSRTVESDREAHAQV
jgi:hypothetical protein